MFVRVAVMGVGVVCVRALAAVVEEYASAVEVVAEAIRVVLEVVFLDYLVVDPVNGQVTSWQRPVCWLRGLRHLLAG